ncbi:hypothetical protein SAMN05216298_3817 [Glycomyces sambucus]|uniref:Uncharacterized protein n=1 Tax=Glycomyces sambucus TaxID=380244 RepID=A0A1G9JR19_9ACTN|nr:hypothetical protein [Glycomyces sambucus]SDL39989.1 hypothetical protein SAMN05216298_3817 [Glycomyces sambucus]
MTATPDPLEPVFTDYTADTTAEVQHSGTDALWRKAKRRRIGRGATAGAAALALLAPAGWLLLNAAGADQPAGAPPGAFGPDATESSRAAELGAEESESEVETDGGDVGAAYSVDFIGDTVDMPSFAPGDAELEAACTVGDTVLGNGMYQGAGDIGDYVEGEAFFVGVTYAAVTAADRALVATGDYDYRDLSLAGLFGCDTGGEILFQAAVVVDDGDGTWTAEQLVHSEPGGETLKGFFTTDEGYELLIGFASRWAPEAELDEDDYWIDKVVLDDDGAVTREPSDYDYWSLVIDMTSHLLAE